MKLYESKENKTKTKILEMIEKRKRKKKIQNQILTQIIVLGM